MAPNSVQMFKSILHLKIYKAAAECFVKAILAVTKPAEIVGVGEVCGESDFSVQFFHSHDVFWTFVPHFTGPVDRKSVRCSDDFSL